MTALLSAPSKVKRKTPDPFPALEELWEDEEEREEELVVSRWVLLLWLEDVVRILVLELSLEDDMEETDVVVCDVLVDSLEEEEKDLEQLDDRDDEELSSSISSTKNRRRPKLSEVSKVMTYLRSETSREMDSLMWVKVWGCDPPMSHAKSPPTEPMTKPSPIRTMVAFEGSGPT